MQPTPHSDRPQIATAFSTIALLALTVSHGFVQETGDRAVVPTKGWPGHARDAQHTSRSSVVSQPLKKIHWHTPVDLHPPIDQVANGKYT